jgi:hypothetical protein
MMNIVLDSQEYLLANNQFAIADDQPQAVFSSVNTLFNARTSADVGGFSATSFATWLEYLRAVSLQVFAISILVAVSHFAHADTTSPPTNYSSLANVTYLADKPQAEWLQLASLIDDEKRPAIFANAKKLSSSWAIAFDNDVLVPGNRDRDYTYGLNLTYSGASAVDAPISLKTPLAYIDGLLGVDQLATNSRDNYSVEVGLYGFTPDGIERETINQSDRPYASLVYLSSSHEQIDVDKNVAWSSTLTVGALGLGWVGNLQNAAHRETAGKTARGWNHQISDGGELTGRYVLARQHYIESFSDSVEVKSTVQASVGYLTETSWGMSFRTGKIISPWASFNPDLTSYGEKSTYSNNTGTANEHYFWSGFTLKARFYNAFLQGQFRDSDFSYSYSDLRPLVAEAWAGYTYAFKQGYRFSYVLRAQSSEIKRGDGDRNVVWGGLIFATTI